MPQWLTINGRCNYNCSTSDTRPLGALRKVGWDDSIVVFEKARKSMPTSEIC